MVKYCLLFYGVYNVHKIAQILRSYLWHNRASNVFLHGNNHCRPRKKIIIKTCEQGLVHWAAVMDNVARLASVLPQRDVVNPVRPGREQPQQLHRVPECGWRESLFF